MQRLGLTEAEIDDLVAFMESLTSPAFAVVAKKEMAKQRAKKTVRPERDTETAMGRKGHLGDLPTLPDPAKPASLGVLVRTGTSYEK
jgi:cytochrome c peroxidase